MAKTKKKVTIKLAPAPARKRAKAKNKQAVNQTTALGSLIRQLGTLGGTALGGMIGAPALGGGLGNHLAGALSRWIGAGDYTVGSNSIVHRMRTASSIPSMHSDNQSVVIRHKEYLGEIRSSTAFEVKDSFILNPGNKRTFPWLSGIARNYQEFSFKGVIFHYIPTSGTAVSGSNPALGSVMMQTSYRSTDTTPSSKVEMLNEYCSNEASPADSFVHPIECDPKENPFNIQYVRSTDVPTGDNQLMYDLGVTHVATAGQIADNNVVGDLWVTYEVELKKPIVASNVTANTLKAFYTSSPASSANLFASPEFTSGNFQLSLSANTITFPKGCVGLWQIIIVIAPTTTFSAVSGWTSATATNGVITNWHPALFASAATVTTIGGTAPTLSNVFVTSGITISDPAVKATWTLPAFTLTGSISTLYLSVTQIAHPGA